MKVHTILSTISMTLVLCGCQVEQAEQVKSNLMDTVQNSKLTAADYFSGLDNDEILSKSSSDCGLEEASLLVPEWAYPYISEYLSQGNVQNWSAAGVCRMVEDDSELMTEQKEYIAQVIGVLEYIKDDALSITIETKLSKDECLALYKETVKEILVTDISVGAIGGGCVGGAIGAELGILGGMLTAWKEIKQAGRDYVRCTAAS